MTPNGILAELRGRGISLEPYGENLRLRVPKGAFPPDLRVQVTENKAEILRLLRGRVPDQLPDTVSSWPLVWADLYEERAAIREYDGNLPREQAEQLAEADVRRSHQKEKILLN